MISSKEHQVAPVVEFPQGPENHDSKDNTVAPLVTHAQEPREHSSRENLVTSIIALPQELQDHLPRARSASRLVALPQELQDHIFTYLDPIGYISLSQTARLFRAVLPPYPHILTARLLQLELTAAHGKHTPLFSGPSQHPLPIYALRNPWWGDAHYACASCMRLRHHRWFRTAMITPVAFRKPSRTSRAANARLEPRDPRSRWALRRRVSDAHGDAQLALWGAHAVVARFVKNTFGRPADVHGWPKPAMQQYPGSNLRGSVWMDELCGLSRHLRRCVGCEARARDDFDVYAAQRIGDWYDDAPPPGRGVLVAPRRVFEDTFVPAPRSAGNGVAWGSGADRLYGGFDTRCLPASVLCGSCERLFLVSDELVAPGKAMDPGASGVQGAARYDGSWECGCSGTARSGRRYRLWTPAAARLCGA